MEVIDGVKTYITDFDGNLDHLPVEIAEEEGPYILAFAAMAKSGRIRMPGKYGVYRTRSDEEKTVYTVYRIIPKESDRVEESVVPSEDG